MVLAMPRQSRHPKTGMFWVRKRVPSDLVGRVGRAVEYVSFETREPAEAKQRHAEAIAKLEAQRELIRRDQRPNAQAVARFAGSFVHLSATVLDTARAADAEIARTGPRGPLHWIPVAINDNSTTANLPTRAGTAVEALTFPMKDSHCVEKLRAAGAVILGKLRMHEFA